GDIKISVLVDRADGVRALRAVHQAFALREPRPGAGLPGPGGPSSFRRRADGVPARGRDLAALTQRLAGMEDIVVSDAVLGTDQGRVTVFDLSDRPGNCLAVFQAVAAGGIVVDMIVQNHTAGRAKLSFSVPRANLDRAVELTQAAAARIAPAARVVK